MEEQMSQPLLVSECFTPGMLEKIFRIPGKSKVFIISNALLTILPFWVLILGADITYVCVMVKILTTLEVLLNQDDISSPEAKELVKWIIESVWILFGIQVFLMAFFCIVSVICLVVNGVSSKKMLSKIGGQWKIGGVMTWIHIMVSIIVVDVIVLVSVGLMLESNVNGTLILSGLMIFLLGTLCCLYLVAVWIFSMVMSIMEMHTSEAGDFENSDEITEGRRLQGFLLMMFVSFVSLATTIAFAFRERIDGRRKLDAQITKGIMMMCYVCLLKLFMYAIYTVYRNESKLVYGEQVDVEDGSGYSIIVTR